MQILVETNSVEFAFNKYINYMLNVVPIHDYSGIQEIKFRDTFSHPKTDPSSLACYLKGNNGHTSIIEINIKNIIKENRISEYLFKRHPEIASLLLSEIVFHEIGHHVHSFKRHGIKHKRWEKFAQQYAEIGYCNYLVSRKKEIISSYKWGTKNILELDKDNRKLFKHNLNDILLWFEENGTTDNLLK